MAGHGSERRGVYLRRLAWAAAASLLLHLITFRGLAVSRVGLDSDAETPAATKPLKTKPKSDFQLTVPRSPSTELPAHEKPLDMAVKPAAELPDVKRETDPAKAVSERAAEEAAGDVTVAKEEVQRTKIETDTQRSEAEALARQAAAEASAAPAAATADTAAIAPAAAAAAEKQPLPAAVAPRPREAAEPIASRWRPKEVALLERLTTRAPVSTARTARETLTADTDPAVAAATRAAAEASTATAEARADEVAAPAAAPAATPQPTIAPAARQAARPAQTRASSAKSATAPAAVDAESPAAATATARMPTVARIDRTGQAPPAATAASTAPGRRQATASASAPATATTVAAAPTAPSAAGTAAPAPAAAALPRGPASRGPSAASGAAARGTRSAEATESATPGAVASTPAGDWVASGKASRTAQGAAAASAGAADAPAAAGPAPLARSEGAASAAAANPTAAATPVPAATGTGSGTALVAAVPKPTIAPATLGRSAGSSRSAAATTRPGAGDTALADADEEEGLSAPSVEAAAIQAAAAGRQRGETDAPAVAARSLERVAAAALPVEGRVRDVAEAFAKRTPINRPADAAPARKVADAKALARADEMVGRGLEFLARSQQADGRWSLGRSAGQPAAEAPKLQSDTAATGLALLSFFGAGHDHFDGPHRDTVRRGLEFLLSVQKDDGDLYLPADDLSNSCSWLYSHGIASMALCEAVGMTGDAIVKPAAEKACRFIAASQHPQLGGWRYAPRTDADLSVSGWMLVALRSGQLAGVKTDDGTLAGVRRLLDGSTTPADPTRYAYNPRNAQQRRSQLSSACMTAVGTLMKLHTGTPVADPGVAESARLLAALKPAYGTPKQRTRDSYLWYYSSQVLVHAGGAGWDPWYGSLVDTLSAAQETSGAAAGSWDPLGTVPDRWGEYGGRLYVTALHLLTLEVPARHLPTYSAAAKPQP